MRTKNTIYLLAACALAVSCSEDSLPDSRNGRHEADYKYVGQAVGNFEASEWYPGGLLGTTLNVTEGCYEDETPAVENMGLQAAFNNGEASFERNFTLNTEPFKGLGPAYLRTSCLDCHPGYGHGKRQNEYRAQFGNGYLLVIYHPSDGANSNDGPYIAEVTGMPQTKAVPPFLPPVDEDMISLNWVTVSSMKSGLPMEFQDGEKYSLIYPVLDIPREAFNTDPVPENIAFRLESTIGIIGSGLLDAIPADSLREQYRKEALYTPLNPAMWDKAADDFAQSAWYTLAEGRFADGSAAPAGTKLPKKFTYALTRASLQDGPGANAIWNITNVTRGDRMNLYTTVAWARAMSQNESVIAAIKQDPSSPYYADGTDGGISAAVLELLSPSTDQGNNNYHNFEPEMSESQFYNFLVWQRGLSIPRARNLNKVSVQKGKRLFTEMGCATCHRPKWTTTDDNYWSPSITGGKPLPRYQNQEIYPYTDMIQHRLHMENDIHGSWCRTTPLWGRGLSKANTGAEERLHDCRARNVVEAIMWHAYSQESEAYDSAFKFYRLSKEDRDAVVEFIDSI